MTELKLDQEQKFELLCNIMRASFFEWLRAAKKVCPNTSQRDLILQFWTEVGHDTAKTYLKHIDPSKPIPTQVAQNMVFSSLCMGEEATMVDGKNDKESFVRHSACPWYGWHKRTGTDLTLDLEGCDKWIEVFVKDLNKALKTDLKWETLESLPEGGEVCLRRFWIE